MISFVSFRSAHLVPALVDHDSPAHWHSTLVSHELEEEALVLVAPFLEHRADLKEDLGEALERVRGKVGLRVSNPVLVEPVGLFDLEA
jgi:hypothetical protein